MFACTIHEYLNVPPHAEPIANFAASVPAYPFRYVATTLAFSTSTEAESAGKRLQTELIGDVDTQGLARWTHVFACDECDVAKVAVYDPYGTCAVVLCANCTGSEAIAGPIAYAE